MAGQTITATRAGIMGSAAMDVAQWAIAAIFERAREPDDVDEEREAIVSVVHRLADFTPGDVIANNAKAVGSLIHYVFGAVFALGYARARITWPPNATARGLAFGVGLWLLSDVVLVPAAHLGRSWFRYSTAERCNALISHLAYALTVEDALRRA